MFVVFGQDPEKERVGKRGTGRRTTGLENIRRRGNEKKKKRLINDVRGVKGLDAYVFGRTLEREKVIRKM